MKLSKKRSSHRKKPALVSLESPKGIDKNLNLEALRGLMALMVVIGHVELMRLYFGRSTTYLNPIFFHIGRVAVTGFFVLSGYLITNSILKRIEYSKWDIGRFYIRRIFRIWPLYYFVIALAILVLPHINQLHFIVPEGSTDVRNATFNYWYYIFFMPQVPLMNYSVLPFAEPTWSIGVEEIFYLIIPWVIITMKNNLAKSLSVFIIIFLVVKYLAIYIYKLPPSNYLAILLNYYRYDCVALGCLLGVLHSNGSKIFSSIKLWHFVLALIAILVFFKNLTLDTYDYFPFGLCFAFFIAYLSNKNCKIRSPKWLVHTGKVSYSLYLTHEIVVVFFVNLGLDKKSMAGMYVLSITLSILLATILYYTIEKPFMNFSISRFNKKKLSVQNTL